MYMFHIIVKMVYKNSKQTSQDNFIYTSEFSFQILFNELPIHYKLRGVTDHYKSHLLEVRPQGMFVCCFFFEMIEEEIKK